MSSHRERRDPEPPKRPISRHRREIPRSRGRRWESPDGLDEEPGPLQPITISKSSTMYRKDGGYGKSRDDRTYKRDNEYSSPSNPLGFEKSKGSYEAAEYYEDSEPRRRKRSADDPLPSIGNLTLDEVVESPRYAVSSSAPVQPSQWASRSGEHDGTSTVIYEETTGHNEVTQTTVEYGDPYGHKGKGVARDAPTSYPSGNDAPHHISGTAGDSEPLDPSYKVRRYDYQKFFRQGRVFSTLWTDPWSNLTNDSENDQFTSVVTYSVAYNERVHSKIRRFVVVKFGNRCCTCLPVTTYNRRGYQKRGIDLNEHGLIYSGNRAPDTIRGIKKQPLKVNLSRGGERLINPSYINYGRFYTVETNVKVKDVGELDSDSRKLLRKYWNECPTFLEDDEGPGSAQSPRGRAADLAGVGSGVTGSPQAYSGSQTSTLGPFPPSMMSGTMEHQSSAGGHPGYSSGGWHSAGSFPATGHHSYVAPTYNSQTGPSSSGYPPPIDNTYEQNSLADAGHDLPFSGYTSHVPQVYPSSDNPNPTATQSPFYSHGMVSPDLGVHWNSYQEKGDVVTMTQPDTPMPQPTNSQFVAGTQGNRELLDRSYQTRSSEVKKWFREGRVFSTLWTDAVGSAVHEYDSGSLSFDSILQYGNGVYLKIRRFVVIKLHEKAGACTCLPVTAYNGRGIAKEGIRLDYHGQIYSGDRAPKIFNEIKKKPLRVRLCSGEQRLDSRSCINYGSPYTIQTNIKVKEIGELDADSRRLLRKYYNEVNFALNEDDYSDPGLPRAAADRAANFRGMGAAEAHTPKGYSEVPPSAFGASRYSSRYPDTYQASHVQQGSGWTGNSGYVFAEQDSFTGSSYDIHARPTPPSAPSSVNYSKDSIHNMDDRRRDDRFIGDSSTVASAGNAMSYPGAQDPTYPNNKYPSAPVASSSTFYTAGLPPHIHDNEESEVQANPGDTEESCKIRDEDFIRVEADQGENHEPGQRIENEGAQPCEGANQDGQHDSTRESHPNSSDPNRDDHTEKHEIEHIQDQFSQEIPTILAKRSMFPAVVDTNRPIQQLHEIKPESDLEPLPIEILGSSVIPKSPSGLLDPMEPVSEGSGLSRLSSPENLIDSYHDLLKPLGLACEVLTERPSLSRRSSVETIESLLSSILSTSDLTSASSISNQSGGAERLSEFLLEQGWLQQLAQDALCKVSLDKFEENLYRSLVQFSAHLKVEASSQVMIAAAGVVRRLARNAANLVRRSLEIPSDLTNAEGSDNEEEDEDENDDDENDDDLLESKEEGEIHEDPQRLEHVLSKSVAFQLLEENLRLFVHPDPIKRALFKIWPISHPRHSPLTIEYDLEWQVSTFLRTHFPEGQELAKVLTITGEAINAQAQSCGDYLTSTWPEIGPALLDRLRDLLFLGSEVTKTAHVASFDMKLGSNTDTDNLNSNISIIVLASYAVQVQVASALSWLCAAIRYSPHQGIVHSSTIISAKKTAGATQKIAIRLAELELIQTDQPCWYPLFPHAVIARGFPIRTRKNGKGLEISFADMALLSQSMVFTEYDEGLIVEGLRSILIPIEMLQQDDAIQWHFEYKRQSESPKKRSISDIFSMSRVSKWHKAQKPYEVIEKRCFLGWAEEISVMIGTAEFSSTKVYRSGADPSPKTRCIKSHSISMGTSGLGFFGANGSTSWQTTSVPSNITLGEIHKDIYDTLADDSDESLLIYDTGNKTAWLLPQPNFILYLTHKVVTKRKYKLFDGNGETAFNFARPGADGASEATSVLRDLTQLKVQKSPTFQESLVETLKQICLLLDLVGGDRLRLAIPEFERIGGGGGTRLYGVEFNDLLEMNSCIEIKQAPIDQPWTRMVKNHGVVLFCTGLGQPIIPLSPEKLCRTYMEVPPSRNLMATTGTVLHNLLEHYDRGMQGSRLGDKVEWNNKQLLVQSHAGGQTDPVFHEQSLRIVKSARLDTSILGLVSSHKSSGFIFAGHDSRTACSEATVTTKSMHTNIATEQPIHVNKALPKLPEDESRSDSSNDVDSETGFDDEPLPPSSTSSGESQQVGMEVAEELDLSPMGLSGSTLPRILGAGTGPHDAAYTTDHMSQKQMSKASSSSSAIPRIVKRKNRCSDLATSLDKGKNAAFKQDARVGAAGNKSGGGEVLRKINVMAHRRGKRP